MGTMLAVGREKVLSAYLSWGDFLNDPVALIGQLHFDVVRTEAHERTAVITEHSVETGVAVADHVRPNVDKLTLTVYVSQVPLNSHDAIRGAQTLPLDKTGQVAQQATQDPGYEQTDPDFAIIQSLRGVRQTSAQPQPISAPPAKQSQSSSITASVDLFVGEIDYVDAAYTKLTALRDSATLLRIQCPRAYYENMIVESIKMDRSAQTGTGADFTLEFRQIRIVSSQVVDAPQPKAVESQPSADVGKKDAKPADDAKGSLLKRRVLSKLVGALLNG